MSSKTVVASVIKRKDSHLSFSRRMRVLWQSMVDRCRVPHHKAFSYYGGRGITVCDEWLKFERFLSDMGPTWRHGLSLERVDNSLGYSPQNCIWATPFQQSRNKRNNINITFNGETMCLADWASRIGVHRQTLRARLKRHSVEEALTTKKQHQDHRGKFFITFNGKSLHLAQWAKETGIKRATIRKRIALGMDLSDVFSTTSFKTGKYISPTRY